MHSTAYAQNLELRIEFIIAAFHILNGNGIHNAIYLADPIASVHCRASYDDFIFAFLSFLYRDARFFVSLSSYVLVVRAEDKREGIQLDKGMTSQESLLSRRRRTSRGQAPAQVTAISIYL